MLRPANSQRSAGTRGDGIGERLCRARQRPTGGSAGVHLTLPLAHAFLLIGDLERMDRCLARTVGNAAYATVSRPGSAQRWDVVSGGWNEQHCYPIAEDFAEPFRGARGTWAPSPTAGPPPSSRCATCCSARPTSGQPHIYLAPGVLPRWVGDGQEVAVSDAPTILGGRFGYRLVHRAATRTLQIDVSQPPPDRVSLVYPCCFGSSVRSATADGRPIQVDGRDVLLPARTRSATVTYL